MTHALIQLQTCVLGPMTRAATHAGSDVIMSGISRNAARRSVVKIA